MHLDKASYDIEIQFSLWPFGRQTFGRRVDKKNWHNASGSGI